MRVIDIVDCCLLGPQQVADSILASQQPRQSFTRPPGMQQKYRLGTPSAAAQAPMPDTRSRLRESLVRGIPVTEDSCSYQQSPMPGSCGDGSDVMMRSPASYNLQSPPAASGHGMLRSPAATQAQYLRSPMHSTEHTASPASAGQAPLGRDPQYNQPSG